MAMAAKITDKITMARLETVVKKANPASTVAMATVQGINRMPRKAAVSEIASKLNISIQNIVLTLRKIQTRFPFMQSPMEKPTLIETAA
jgi:hypothetical protein